MWVQPNKPLQCSLTFVCCSYKPLLHADIIRSQLHHWFTCFYCLCLKMHLRRGSKSLIDAGLQTSFPSSLAPPNVVPFYSDESHSQHSEHKSHGNAQFSSKMEEKHPGYLQVCYFFLVCSREEEVLRERLPPSVSEVSEVQQTAHSWTACWGKKKRCIRKMTPWVCEFNHGVEAYAV